MAKCRKRKANGLSPKIDHLQQKTQQFPPVSTDISHPSFLLYTAMSVAVSLVVSIAAQYCYNRSINQQRSTVCFTEMDGFINNSSDREVYLHDIQFLSALSPIPSAYLAGSDYKGSEYEQKIYQFIRGYCQIGERAGYTNVLIEVGLLHFLRDKVRLVDCYNKTVGNIINEVGFIMQNHKTFSVRQRKRYCASAVKNIELLVDQIKVFQLQPMGAMSVLMAATTLFLVLALSSFLWLRRREMDREHVMQPQIDESFFSEKKNKKSPKNKKKCSPKNAKNTNRIDLSVSLNDEVSPVVGEEEGLSKKSFALHDEIAMAVNTENDEASHVVGEKEGLSKKPFSLHDEIAMAINTDVDDDSVLCFYSQVESMIFLVNSSSYWELHSPRYLSQGSYFFSVALPVEAYQLAFNLFQQQRCVHQFVRGRWSVSDALHPMDSSLVLTEASRCHLSQLFDNIQSLQKDEGVWSFFCNVLNFFGPRLTKDLADHLLRAGFSPGHEVVRSFQMNKHIVGAVSTWGLRNDNGSPNLSEEMNRVMLKPQGLVRDRCLPLYDSLMQLVAQLDACRKKTLKQAMTSILMESSLSDWLCVEDQQSVMLLCSQDGYEQDETDDAFLIFELLSKFTYQLSLLSDLTWLPLSHDLMSAFHDTVGSQPVNQLFEHELNEETTGLLSYLLNKEKDKGGIADNLLAVFCQFFANHFSIEQMQRLYLVKSSVGHDALDVKEINHLVFQLGVKLERSSDTTLQSLSTFLLNQYYLNAGENKVPLQCLRTGGECFRIGLHEGISQLIAVPEFLQSPPHYVALLRETAQFEALLSQYKQQFSVLISLFFPEKKLSIVVHKFTFKTNDIIKQAQNGSSHDDRVSAPFVFYAVDAKKEPSTAVLRMLLTHLFHVSSNALVARAMKTDTTNQYLFLSHVHYHQLINEKCLIVDALHQHQSLKMLSYHDLNAVETLLMACLLGLRVKKTDYISQLFVLLLSCLVKKVSLHDKQATRICLFLLDHPTLRRQPMVRPVHEGVSQLHEQDAEFSSHLSASLNSA